MPPTTTDIGFGATVTLATGTAETVTAAVPLWPSLVAVIVTGPPADTPVTIPLAFTVASAVLPEAQVITRPVSTFPLASFVVAVSCTVPPATTDAGLGVTVTVDTGTAVTVTAAVPLWPSLVAVIVTGPPAATPVTTPLPSTVATDVLLDAQVIARPVSTFPFASFVVAVSCTVPPATTDAGFGVTVTAATGTGAGLNAAATIAHRC